MTYQTLLTSGPLLDAEVARVVMGAVRVIVNDIGWVYGALPELIESGDLPKDHGRCRLPSYSSNMLGAMRVVQRVQTLYPGWRFSLLGGDSSFDYQVIGPDNYLVDPENLNAFGWRAAFFGHIDPTKNHGQRHADVWAETPEVAICMAAINAIKANS